MYYKGNIFNTIIVKFFFFHEVFYEVILKDKKKYSYCSFCNSVRGNKMVRGKHLFKPNTNIMTLNTGSLWENISHVYSRTKTFVQLSTNTCVLLLWSMYPIGVSKVSLETCCRLRAPISPNYSVSAWINDYRLVVISVWTFCNDIWSYLSWWGTALSHYPKIILSWTV